MSADPQPPGDSFDAIRSDGKPVWAAYEINDAITRTCPTCEQPPEHACINPITDSARKIPCCVRLREPKEPS